MVVNLHGTGRNGIEWLADVECRQIAGPDCIEVVADDAESSHGAIGSGFTGGSGIVRCECGRNRYGGKAICTAGCRKCIHIAGGL